MKAPSFSQRQARRLWIQAQGLDKVRPFGRGAEATLRAIRHLGHIQIDTIHVIERCHHHILFSRIPDYKTEHLHQAQSLDKSVFEYWTHALSYLPVEDFRFFVPEMQRRENSPSAWYRSVSKGDIRRLLERIEEFGPLSIRDIKDDVLVEKTHEWESRKPSKKVMNFAFNVGKLTISERIGMLKKYELTERHFDWESLPEPPSEEEFLDHIIERAFRAQGLVTSESVCFLSPFRKPALRRRVQELAEQKRILPAKIEGLPKADFWIRPDDLGKKVRFSEGLTRFLSPYDPLVIQRKRLKALFDYDYLFEAYLPAAKRKYGYFALPVLMDDEIVAALDLKTDREKGKVLIQKWTWIGKHKSAEKKKRIEEEMERFEKFQLGK